MRVWRRSGMGALLLLAATGFPVLAEAEPERVRIQIMAPKTCADEAAFLRALRKRTSRFQLASGTAEARTFVATVARAGLFVSGRLEIRGPGTQVSVRDVSGRNCEEVVAALAFMTALVIDTNAPEGGASPSPLSAPSPISAAPAAPAAASPGVPFSSERPQQEKRPRILRSPEPAPSSSLTAPATPPAAASVSPRWTWAAGAAGQASFAVSPTVGAGGSLFLEAASPVASGWSPALRAGLFASQSDARLASGAGARFQWAGTLVEGCPVRLALADAWLTLRPCLFLRLSALRGTGRELDEPKQTTDLWADLGPLARVRLAISNRFFLEVEGGLVIPLRHLTFEVRDRGPTQAATTVFDVPALGAVAGLGVAYELR